MPLAFQKFVNSRFNAQLATDSAVGRALSQARLVISTLGWMHQLHVANFPNQYPEMRRHPWTTGNIGLYMG